MKLNGTYCGEFYSNANRDQHVASVWKLGQSRYVLRSVNYGRIEWESAEFTGKEFRKCGGLNLGYAREVHYTTA